MEFSSLNFIFGDISLKNFGISKSNYDNVYTVPIIFGVISTVLLFFRIMIDNMNAFGDEAFYLTAALQLVNGDAMLVDSWDPVQTHGFLLMPFVWLFKHLLGGIDGVFLYLRIIWFIIKITASVIFYRIVAKRDGIMAATGIFIFLVSDPFNMSTLSYNTIVVLCAMVTTTIIYRGEYKRGELYLLGVIWAISIIAQPYCLVLPFIYLCSVVVFAVRKKQDGLYNFSSLIKIGIAGFITGGICICFVLTRASVGEVIASIPHILNQPGYAVGGVPLNWMRIIYAVIGHLKLETLIQIVILGVVCFRKKETSIIILPISSVICLCITISNNAAHIMNLFFYSFVFIAIDEIIILVKYHKDLLEKWLRIFFWISVYALAVATGTDSGVLSPTGFLAVVAVFDIILFTIIAGRQKKSNLIVSVSAWSVVIICLVLHLTICWERTMVSINDFSNFVDFGPLKYTFMNDELYSDYKDVVDDFASLNLTEDDRLMCLTYAPIGYLCSEAQVASPILMIGFSGYEFDGYRDQLMNYMESRPNKVPTVVYVRRKDAYENMFDSELYEWFCGHYEMQEMSSGIIGRLKSRDIVFMEEKK